MFERRWIRLAAAVVAATLLSGAAQQCVDSPYLAYPGWGELPGDR